MFRKIITSSLAAACMVGTALVAGASPASAADSPSAGCRTFADAPTYSGGNIVYSGGITDCRDNHYRWVTVSLYMDDTYMTNTANACTGKQCSDLGQYPNRAGNQRWCSEVEVYDSISTDKQLIGYAYTCENNGY
ncbi:hypothetical protein ABZ612_36450 [Streptomyces avermitilis]|uniref:hypothetical protein n=1 Tax=Streptomyces avermitilis TaxID=33903 RepID=UPI003406A009